MKRFLTPLGAIVVIASGVSPILAGPEPLPSGKESKAVVQPTPPPECNWTGFYIGGFGGYSWGSVSFREEHETDPAYEFDQDSFLGGGEIGFNWQFGSLFVLGVEGTFAGGDFSDTADIFPGGEHSRGHVDSSWLATIGGRIGMSFWHNRLLVYAKGGAAFTDFDYHTEEINGGGEHFDASDDQVAGLVGGGLEYAFTCHWSVKLEYNHLFFGSEDVTGLETTGGPGLEKTFSSDVDCDTITAGINFKF